MNTQQLVYSVLLGFAVIFNVISSSYLEFYPDTLLIGIAFAIGISMVVGSAYYMLREPGLLAKVKYMNIVRAGNPLASGRVSATAY